MSELKPCPLCGREVTLKRRTTEGLPGLSIGCAYCQLYKEWSGLYNSKTEREFVDGWNARALSATDGQQSDLSATDGNAPPMARK